MGANSSSTKSSDADLGGERKSSSGSVRRSGVDGVRQQPLHRGPVHCVCAVEENTTIASAGADKVSDAEGGRG